MRCSRICADETANSHFADFDIPLVPDVLYSRDVWQALRVKHDQPDGGSSSYSGRRRIGEVPDLLIERYPGMP
jgi:hypothetical protein